MHRTTRAVLALVTLSLGMSYLSERKSSAFPSYMRKEGLTSCGYCHVAEKGKGPRNYRGAYYKMHGNSFAGFDDAAEAKAAGAEIAPDATEKPASLTPPAPAATPTPAPVVAKPTPAPVAATKSASAVAADKAHAAMLASQKAPKDAKLKAAYVTSLNNLSKAYLGEKKNADAATAAKRALGLDPKNATAKANLAAATKK